MEYHQKIQLKDGRECTLRSGTAQDAAGVMANFILTHEQTDNLLTYPDEVTLTPEQEAEYLKKKAESPCEAALLAEVDGKVVGTAGVDSIGRCAKLRHRASFGISVERDYWRLGIGRALTMACIECAGAAGYTQLELEVLASNKHALALYKSVGFVEYGRNPRGFCSRTAGEQELVMMRLELDRRA